MSRVRAASGAIGPFETITLDNGIVRTVIIPELGGRVWELEDRIRQRQWIWNKGLTSLRRQPVGACYDEVWAGGWEELFPNDASGQFEGRDLPDHGEWWATPWQVEEPRDGEDGVVRLFTELAVRRTSCIKEFRLAAGSPTLVVDYSIRSRESSPFHFLFKQHFPVRLTPECRLRLPGGRVQAVDPAFSTLVDTAGEFEWPLGQNAGERVDMQVVPPASSGLREFLYLRDLPAGWCGVDDRAAGASLRMSFDVRQLPYLWLFLAYGGWRDCYTAVLEPCSNLPKDLDEAVRLGQSARLAPGQEFRTRVCATLTSLLPIDVPDPHNTAPVMGPSGGAC